MVLNEFWGPTTASYKVPVFDAMGRIGVSIVISVFGHPSTNDALTLPSLALIGEGLVLHTAVVVILVTLSRSAFGIIQKG